MTADNLRHWNALRKTDPKHTKGFTRAGGFKGTAIKPIYMVEKMTEHFGPCGVGWGMEAPDFVTYPVGDELLVYCTVAVWFMDGDKRAGPVYGVGGDKVAVKRQSGVIADDEALKKAYTDALSNAMKQIGVGADVHMGLFDDAKYVSELRREFAEDDAPPARTQSANARPETRREEPAGRDEAFFRRTSYAIDPKAAGSWSRWESQFRAAARDCKNDKEFERLEGDNLSHRIEFEKKAAPPVVESLRQYMNAQRDRLLPGLVP